jgi:hypothetical protein
MEQFAKSCGIQIVCEKNTCTIRCMQYWHGDNFKQGRQHWKPFNVLILKKFNILQRKCNVIHYIFNKKVGLFCIDSIHKRNLELFLAFLTVLATADHKNNWIWIEGFIYSRKYSTGSWKIIKNLKTFEEFQKFEDF